MGRPIGGAVMWRPRWRGGSCGLDWFGLDWFAFARPMWDGYMEECNDR